MDISILQEDIRIVDHTFKWGAVINCVFGFSIFVEGAELCFSIQRDIDYSDLMKIEAYRGCNKQVIERAIQQREIKESELEECGMEKIKKWAFRNSTLDKKVTEVTFNHLNGSGVEIESYSQL